LAKLVRLCFGVKIGMNANIVWRTHNQPCQILSSKQNNHKTTNKAPYQQKSNLFSFPRVVIDKITGDCKDGKQSDTSKLI